MVVMVHVILRVHMAHANLRFRLVIAEVMEVRKLQVGKVVVHGNVLKMVVLDKVEIIFRVVEII